MLRPVTREDGPAVVDLVVAAGMFTRDEAAFLEEALAPAEGTTCLVEDVDGGGLASVVPYRPEEAADRAFDLTMIAVRPDLQGEGRGAGLMRHVEQDLRDQGQRMLVVRTSGTARYDRTRAFYRGSGTPSTSACRTTEPTVTTWCCPPSGFEEAAGAESSRSRMRIPD